MQYRGADDIGRTAVAEKPLNLTGETETPPDRTGVEETPPGCAGEAETPPDYARGAETPPDLEFLHQKMVDFPPRGGEGRIWYGID